MQAPRDPTTTTPHRPCGLTATPLTYQPPLAEDATDLPFASTRAPADDPSIDPLHRPEPVRALRSLGAVPVLLLTGEASYHSTYDHRTADFLRDAGVTIDHVHLADQGIRGNGHLLTLENNRADIADLVERWLSDQDR